MAQTTILYASLATPVNAAFSTATTGGTLAAGTYSYRVSALYGSGGETLASTATTQATTGATSTVTVNWGAVAGATGYKVYGRVGGSELLLATVGAVTTWTDTGANTPAGALPAANTTGAVAATSADVVVAAGASVTIGIFTADAAGIPGNEGVQVFIDTPGVDQYEVSLTGVRPTRVISGPGTFRAKRGVTTVSLGVFTET